MNRKLSEVQDSLLGKVNDLCNKFGLNNIIAQIYTVLYFSEKPLSLNDMVERLKISKSSVSVNVRALERYGAVRNVWVKGSRRDYYEAESDISKVIIDRVKSMARSRLSEVSDMMGTALKTVDSINASDKGESEQIRLFKQKLDKLRSLQNKAQSLFDFFNSGLWDSVFKIESGRQNKKAKEVISVNRR